MAESTVSAAELGKRYRIGDRDRPTLLSEAARSAFERLRRSSPGRGAGGVKDEEVWALRDVSLEVPEGQALGVIGRNGSGKTTLLKILARVTEPTAGRAVVRGRVGALIELGTGFHPELTGRENVFLNGAILGMSRAEIRSRFDEIVEFSGVERFLDTPIKRYSSGMKVRLAFAVAAHLRPDVILIDEVLAVGDASFQRRCLEHMQRLGQEGTTLLFVSHDLRAVERLCERVVWLEEGRVVDDGPSARVVRDYELRRERSGGGEWPAPLRARRDREIRLHALRLAGADGVPRTTFRRGEPAFLELDLEVLEPRHSLRAGFELMTQGSVVVFRGFYGERDPSTEPLAAGRWRLRCALPTELLSNRVYSINARVGLERERWCVWEDDVLQLDIVAHAENRWVIGPEVISPALRWESEVLEAAALSPSP